MLQTLENNITLTTRLEVTSVGYGAITVPLTDQLTVEEGDVYGFHFDEVPAATPFTYTVSQAIQHNYEKDSSTL